MQKLNILLAISCALILQDANAGYRRPLPKDLEKLKVNDTKRDVTYTQEIDLTIHSDIQAFTLSNNQSQLFIKPKSRAIKFCTLNLTTALGHAYQVAEFDEKIVLWDQQTYADNVIGTTLLLIDPIICNYTNIEVPTDKILKNQPPYKAQVVTYKKVNYFDIFYGGRNSCMPCRFNSQGEKLEVQYRLGKNETFQDASPYLIRPLKESNPKGGYFYARSFYNGSLWTEINLLRHNFSVIRNISVDHAIDEVAINDNNSGDFVVCYKQEDQKYARVIQNDGRKVWRMISQTNVYCDIYDKFLILESHIKLAIPKDHYVNGITLTIGKDSSLCVAVPDIAYDGKDNKYSLGLFRFSGLTKDSTELHGSLGSVKPNFDDREGYNLKVRGVRELRFHCS